MDILYYSNRCKHSQKILSFLSKANLLENVNCICIDKRVTDKKTGNIFVVLENGKQVFLPPMIHEVPALLIPSKNYQTILGDNIIGYFEPAVQKQIKHVGNEEPSGFILGGNFGGIVSEKFTSYSMTSDELKGLGHGPNRELHHYVNYNNDGDTHIYSAEETYKPNKISSELTIDQLKQMRDQEIPQLQKPASLYL